MHQDPKMVKHASRSGVLLTGRRVAMPTGSAPPASARFSMGRVHRPMGSSDQDFLSQRERIVEGGGQSVISVPGMHGQWVYMKTRRHLSQRFSHQPRLLGDLDGDQVQG